MNARDGSRIPIISTTSSSNSMSDMHPPLMKPFKQRSLPMVAKKFTQKPAVRSRMDVITSSGQKAKLRMMTDILGELSEEKVAEESSATPTKVEAFGSGLPIEKIHGNVNANDNSDSVVVPTVPYIYLIIVLW